MVHTDLEQSYGAGNNIDLVAFPLLVDTIYYLIDGMSLSGHDFAVLTPVSEIPSDSKATPFDPLYNYPKCLPRELPADMPVEYLNKLQSLLPHAPPNAYVLNLVNTYRDATGTLVYGSPVINRPWEWMENLGEPSVLDPKEEENEREQKERLKTRYLVKNSGSLSLEHFAAQTTGDGIIPTYDDPRDEGNVRLFEDGLSAESVFMRDWRESRVGLDDATLLNQARPRAEDIAALLSNQPKRPTPRASPVGSSRSRTSVHICGSGSSTSMKQSPLNRLSTSTTGEPIDVNATVGTSATEKPVKRKAAEGSDDEIEIGKDPIPVKRVKTKSTRARGRKR